MRSFNVCIIVIALLATVLSGCNGTGKNEKQTGTFKLSVMKAPFGNIDNKEVFLYTLTNKNGVIVKITNYGAIITHLIMPDKNGKPGDIVLGYDSLSGYLRSTPYFGAIVGRYANRIRKGEFTIDGQKYHLAKNNGNNHLHGGIKGFDKVVWDAVEIQDTSSVGLVLTYFSKDGEEGYPGNLNVKVTYLLNDNNELSTLIEATTDKACPVNICNHSYFNLREADTSILGHTLTIFADKYTEVNGELIPTGKLLPVKSTPMDFTVPQIIGSRIEQVKGGYDHNYVLKNSSGKLALAATLADAVTGRMINIFTTQPGIQFYSGNFLDGTITGKNGKAYKQHWGLCLETQHFPDSPNHPDFPNTILIPKEKYSQETVYKLLW